VNTTLERSKMILVLKYVLSVGNVLVLVSSNSNEQ